MDLYSIFALVVFLLFLLFVLWAYLSDSNRTSRAMVTGISLYLALYLIGFLIIGKCVVMGIQYMLTPN